MNMLQRSRWNANALLAGLMSGALGLTAAAQQPLYQGVARDRNNLIGSGGYNNIVQPSNNRLEPQNIPALNSSFNRFRGVQTGLIRSSDPSAFRVTPGAPTQNPLLIGRSGGPGFVPQSAIPSAFGRAGPLGTAERVGLPTVGGALGTPAYQAGSLQAIRPLPPFNPAQLTLDAGTRALLNTPDAPRVLPGQPAVASPGVYQPGIDLMRTVRTGTVDVAPPTFSDLPTNSRVPNRLSELRTDLQTPPTAIFHGTAGAVVPANPGAALRTEPGGSTPGLNNALTSTPTLSGQVPGVVPGRLPGEATLGQAVVRQPGGLDTSANPLAAAAVPPGQTLRVDGQVQPAERRVGQPNRPLDPSAPLSPQELANNAAPRPLRPQIEAPAPPVVDARSGRVLRQTQDGGPIRQPQPGTGTLRGPINPLAPLGEAPDQPRFGQLRPFGVEAEAPETLSEIDPPVAFKAPLDREAELERRSRQLTQARELLEAGEFYKALGVLALAESRAPLNQEEALLRIEALVGSAEFEQALRSLDRLIGPGGELPAMPMPHIEMARRKLIISDLLNRLSGSRREDYLFWLGVLAPENISTEPPMTMVAREIREGKVVRSAGQLPSNVREAVLQQ